MSQVALGDVQVTKELNVKNVDHTSCINFSDFDDSVQTDELRTGQI